MKNKNIIILAFVFILCAIAAVFAFYSLADESTDTSGDNSLYLKAYENTVALYKNEKIEEIYEDIVLNALPIKDQNMLKQGILINNDEELLELLEDFDG